MKKIILCLLLILGITSSFSQENENVDLPESTGDNFNLEGALALFKQSNSLEEFEKLLNEENNNVNNLDLNNDGETDYIVVQDIHENDTHAVVLSTFLNETEKQNIAVIGIEKTGNEAAMLQIEGDPDLYAENSIVEPFDADEKLEKPNSISNTEGVATNNVVVNVWYWPSVRSLYAPGYKAWVSPHRWRNYPRWWKPWKPYRYSVFYGKGIRYRSYFRRTNTHKVVVAKRIYAPRRKKSTIVVHKNRRGKTTVVKTKRMNKRR